jgi:hypothetical protein
MNGSAASLNQLFHSFDIMEGHWPGADVRIERVTATAGDNRKKGQDSVYVGDG